LTLSHPPGGIQPPRRYTHQALDDVPEQAGLLADVLRYRLGPAAPTRPRPGGTSAVGSTEASPPSPRGYGGLSARRREAGGREL